MQSHADLLRHLEVDLDYPVLVKPDAQGRPQRTGIALPPNGRWLEYRQSVVVASRDRQRAMVLQGPICHHDFNAAGLRAEIADRETQMIAFATNPWPVYQRFLHLLERRRARQQQWWDGPELERIEPADLGWLEPGGDPQSGCCQVTQPLEETPPEVDPLDHWTERGFPFASAGWPVSLESPELYVECEIERAELETIETIAPPSGRAAFAPADATPQPPAPPLPEPARSGLTSGGGPALAIASARRRRRRKRLVLQIALAPTETAALEIGTTPTSTSTTAATPTPYLT